MQFHRYLQTITAWYTACQHLIAFKGTITALDVFCLTPSIDINITHGNVKAFVNAYTQQLELVIADQPDYLAKAKAVFTKQNFFSKDGKVVQDVTRLSNQKTVHAEASLMALVSAASQASQENPLEDQIPEGVFPVSH